MTQRLLIWIAWISCALVASAQDPKPNVIFMLPDGMGFGDAVCCGQNLIQTPNIDRLTAESVRFTQACAGTSVKIVSIAKQHPEVVRRLVEILKREHDPDPLWSDYLSPKQVGK